MMTDYFNKMEKKSAKKDGAKLVKNSGRGFVKGDATLGSFCIDYKHPNVITKQFTIKVGDWLKHSRDAWNQGMEPVVVPVLDGAKLAIVDWELLKDMIAAYDYVNRNSLWGVANDKG